MMFPYFWDYPSVLNLQNIAISHTEGLLDIARALEKISNDHSAIYSFWGSVIIGCITIWLTIQQCKITKRQHNLDLFNKRWLALEELKQLGREAESFQHVYHQDVKNDEENFFLLGNKLIFFANKCGVLFDEAIKKGILKSKKSFEEYHINLNASEDLQRYKGRLSEDAKRDKYERLARESMNLNAAMYHDFDDIYNKMLNFIQNTQV